MENSYYQILGLAPTATSQEIKDAYRQLVRLHHPDANPTNRETAEAMMKDVLRAYATLCDPAKRARYDNEAKLKEFENSFRRPGNFDNSTVTHHAPTYSKPTSLLARVRDALGDTSAAFAERLGLSETALSELEERDAVPQSPIQLRTFTNLVERAADNLDKANKLSEAHEIRSALSRKKAGRAFLR